MFGSSLMLAAVVLTLKLSIGKPSEWILPGLLFGIALLTRFQALGLVIGVAMGVLLTRGCNISMRVKSAGMLVVSAVVLVLLWNGFLFWMQGYVPKNTNSAHLALALEPFNNWTDTSKIMKYENFWAVLNSRWTAPIEIAAFAAKNALKFPFTIGYELFFLGAGWLIPGAVVAFARDDAHWPSLMALTVGLVTTGIGSLGWVHYYVPFIPLGIVFIVNAIRAMSGSSSQGVKLISWAIVLASTVAWSPNAVRTTFLNTNWPEFTTAREYIEAHRDSNTIVSTTAAGFRYGLTVPFKDSDDILRPRDSKEVASRLREAGVTYLIVTERHTLHNFPDFKYLLEDRLDHPPEGLNRELLIREPRRLAIYRVLPQ
jgi:hypothetical protein